MLKLITYLAMMIIIGTTASAYGEGDRNDPETVVTGDGHRETTR